MCKSSILNIYILKIEMHGNFESFGGVPFQAAVVFILGPGYLLAHSVTLWSFPSITNYLNQTVCDKLRSA